MYYPKQPKQLGLVNTNILFREKNCLKFLGKFILHMNDYFEFVYFILNHVTYHLYSFLLCFIIYWQKCLVIQYLVSGSKQSIFVVLLENLLIHYLIIIFDLIILKSCRRAKIVIFPCPFMYKPVQCNSILWYFEKSFFLNEKSPHIEKVIFCLAIFHVLLAS